MLNEENMEYYTEETSSGLNNGTSSQASGEMDYEDEQDEEFCKYRKEQIF
jgi:hypothetical protein